MQWKLAAALWAATSCRLFAQSTQTPLTFEVASVKPSLPDALGMMLQLQPGGGLRATNLTLKQLLAFAYDVHDFQISGGPAWINSVRYDIQARADHTSDAPASPDDFRKLTDSQRKSFQDQMRERMRALLAERFEVVVHHESRAEPVYALVVAKGGPRLQESKESIGGRQGITAARRGQFSGTSAPIPLLANVLSNQVGRPVLDKTGLTRKYDFRLEWTPDPSENFGPPGIEAPPPPDPNGPTLFTAVQEQLGLRLESQKSAVDVIVIDHAEKPSQN
jgi:bla regulator protein BlaR1